MLLLTHKQLLWGDRCSRNGLGGPTRSALARKPIRRRLGSQDPLNAAVAGAARMPTRVYVGHLRKTRKIEGIINRNSVNELLPNCPKTLTLSTHTTLRAFLFFRPSGRRPCSRRAMSARSLCFYLLTYFLYYYYYYFNCAPFREHVTFTFDVPVCTCKQRFARAYMYTNKYKTREVRAPGRNSAACLFVCLPTHSFTVFDRAGCRSDD